MADKSDEYNSLRQEILQHQSRREAVLSLALTVTLALFAASVQIQKPYLPLLALLLLHSARVQITQIHAGIQRISTYIRVVLEEEQPDLRWEIGSYLIRSISTRPVPGIERISSLAPIDSILLLSGTIAIILSLILALILPETEKPFALTIVGAAAIFWFILWRWHQPKVNELEDMTVDEKEASFWYWFKSSRAFANTKLTQDDIKTLRAEAIKIPRDSAKPKT